MQYQLLKWILLFILYAFSINRINAQENAIKGIVVDQMTNSPVEFVSISLIGVKDSIVVAGILTRQNGSFRLNSIRSGMYFLKAVSLSYQPFTFELALNANQTVLQLV